MKFDSHVIYKPRSQPRLQRGFFNVAGLAFWAAYAYLLLPLLTLLLWLLGIRTAMFELYLNDRQLDPSLLLPLAATAVGIAVGLILWAEYNRYRFGEGDRRDSHPDVQPEELARALGSPSKIAQQLSQSKVAILRMDQSARPVELLDGMPNS